MSCGTPSISNVLAEMYYPCTTPTVVVVVVVMVVVVVVVTVVALVVGDDYENIYVFGAVPAAGRSVSDTVSPPPPQAIIPVRPRPSMNTLFSRKTNPCVYQWGTE